MALSLVLSAFKYHYLAAACKVHIYALMHSALDSTCVCVAVLSVQGWGNGKDDWLYQRIYTRKISSATLWMLD